MADYADHNVPTHWQKLVDLIEKAKHDPDLGEAMRHGKPSQVAEILQAEVDMSMDELALLFDDLEHIADRNSLQYWSPLR